jgi:hypothetical protein
VKKIENNIKEILNLYSELDNLKMKNIKMELVIKFMEILEEIKVDNLLDETIKDIERKKELLCLMMLEIINN